MYDLFKKHNLDRLVLTLAVTFPSWLFSQGIDEQTLLLGKASLMAAEFEQSEAIGISPNGHVFGSMSNRDSRNPSAFSYDGKTQKLIPLLSQYKEFHALDSSDAGLVVGYSFVKRAGSTGPSSLPVYFEHELGESCQLGNELGQATGVSADGNRIVGNVKGRPTVWQKSRKKQWLSTELKGPSGEPVTVSKVIISPDGKTIAASGSFGDRRSRSLDWKRNSENSWKCVEYTQGSTKFFATEQVNNSGWRIGTYTRSTGQNVAAILIPQKGLISIGGHNELAQSFGRDINNEGTALVYSYHKDEQACFLFEDKKRTYLKIDATDNSLPLPGFVARGISNQQIIVGTLDTALTNRYRASMWKPTQSARLSGK